MVTTRKGTRTEDGMPVEDEGRSAMDKLYSQIPRYRSFFSGFFLIFSDLFGYLKKVFFCWFFFSWKKSGIFFLFLIHDFFPPIFSGAEFVSGFERSKKRKRGRIVGGKAG